MPGISMMRPQHAVQVVRAPPGVHPRKVPQSDGRDQIIFSREDQRYFHVDKILGSGAFGLAAKVRVLRTDEKFRAGETIVIKQVRLDETASRERMMEEFMIARRLGKHENIVEMFALMPDCRDGSGKLCDRLFMRYCNAGTLDKIIQLHAKANLPLPEDFIWFTLGSLAYGLARMHNGLNRDTMSRSPDWTGYVHYDLKPDNVILHWSEERLRAGSVYPTPKLADFGCAGRIGRRAKWAGHNLYISPEVARDRHRPCLPECDIWSLGLVIYEMMEFAFPFQKIKSRGGFENDLRNMRSMRSGYSSQLKRIVLWCLDFDYHRRPGAEELVHECKKRTRDIKAGTLRPKNWGHPNLLMERPRY